MIQKIVFHHAFQLISENVRHSGEKSMDKVNQPTLHFKPATLATREKALADLTRSLVGERILLRRQMRAVIACLTADAVLRNPESATFQYVEENGGEG